MIDDGLTVGQYLKKRREEKEVSLKHVAEVTGLASPIFKPWKGMSSIACQENVSPAGFSGTMRGLSRLTRTKSWPPTGPRQGQTENKCWADPADRPFLILS